MEAQIKTINEKKLIGKKLSMSFADFKVGQLWASFMPRRNEISKSISTDMISMAVYQPTHFSNFNPQNTFDRWAAVEVSDFSKIPEGMESFTLPGGQYAVFNYKGLNTDSSIFQYIYSKWIPQSQYALDNRPHFEVLGSKYKNNDPNSEEEIWIPIKAR